MYEKRQAGRREKDRERGEGEMKGRKNLSQHSGGSVYIFFLS